MSTDVRRAIAGIGAMLTFAASFLAAGALGGWHGVTIASPNMGYCERINGNTDGSPCIEQDSRGRWTANDSSDYRQSKRR